MKFLSEKWYAEYEKNLRKEFSAEKTTTHESVRMLELYRKCPDGKDRWMLIDIEKGLFNEFRYGEGKGTMPRDPDFRLYADYETWIRALSGKDDLTQDVLNGKIEFYGSLVKFQPAMKPFVRAVLSQGLVTLKGDVLFGHAMQGVSALVDKKMFS